MVSRFTKLWEALWFIKPVPVLTDTDVGMYNSVFSGKNTDAHIQKTLLHKQKIIDAQQQKMETMEHDNIKISRIIGAIGLSIGILLGGWAMSVISQSSPDSVVQKVSSNVAKILWSEKTAYDAIQEQQKNILIQKEQKEVLELYKKLNATQDELLKVKNTQIELLTSKITNLASDIEWVKLSIQELSWKTNQVSGKNSSLPSQKIPSESLTTSSGIAEKVASYIQELNKKSSSEFLIKSHITQEGRVLVWMEWNGKKSLWYYADSPKYTQRLSLEGMQRWANTMHNALAHIDTVEQIAREKQLSLTKNDATTPFFVQVSQEYSGTIKVIVQDTSLNKAVIFYTLPKDSPQVIHNKFEKVLNGFLS